MDRVNAWLFGRWRPAGLVVNVPEGRLPNFEVFDGEGRVVVREWREILQEEREIVRMENGRGLPAGVARRPQYRYVQEEMTRELRRGYTEGYRAGMRSMVLWHDITAGLLCVAAATYVWLLVAYFRKN